jgi:hypothetical protein
MPNTSIVGIDGSRGITQVKAIYFINLPTIINPDILVPVRNPVNHSFPSPVIRAEPDGSGQNHAIHPILQPSALDIHSGSF